MARPITIRAALLMILLVPATGHAQPPAQNDVSGKAVKPNLNDPNFMICRKQQLAGPLPRYKRVCRTRQERIAQDGRRQDDLEAVANQRLINSCATLRCR